MDISTIPLVLQYNKRDLPDVYGVSELEEKLNKHKAPYFEAVAVTGEGVFPTLKKLSQMVLESLNRQQASMAVKGQRKVSDTKEAAPAQASRARAQVPVAAMAGAEAAAGPRRRGALRLPRHPRLQRARLKGIRKASRAAVSSASKSPNHQESRRSNGKLLARTLESDARLLPFLLRPPRPTRLRKRALEPWSPSSRWQLLL
jgi:hypothetical protein